MSALSTGRARAIVAARACLGTRFRHQGRLAGVGLDCVGLIAHVARTLKLSDYDYLHYGRLPHAGALQHHLGRAGLVPIAPATALPGDVLLFRFDAAPQHVALKTEHGMIHAFLLARRVVEHRIDDIWAVRLCAAYRFPGLD
ncbi:MAG: peptidase P60 [Alphaproteobacteria bacterium]|nr:MAG: peptidase P60 [Alphaproteobacteria bacterium]